MKFWDSNICPVSEGVRCIEVSDNGSSIALCMSTYLHLKVIPLSINAVYPFFYSVTHDKDGNFHFIWR